MHNNGKDQLRTFQAKTDDAIFLGYSTTSKAYRVFNKRSLVVEESIHVVFNESQRSLNSEVDISTVRFKEMNLSDKKKLERRPTYEEVEEIRIKTVEGTADSAPAQSEPAGTEHLDKKMIFKKLQRI